MDSKTSTVSVEDEAADGLSGARWEFFLLGSMLVVDQYQVWEKVSKRHKAVVSKAWSRLDRSGSTMQQEDVPLTTEIATRAKAQWLAKLDAVVSVGFQSRK